MLDVILLKEINLAALGEVVQDILHDENRNQQLMHWYARSITIEAEPAQPFALDGEAGGETPVQIRVMPAAFKVIVPGEPEQEN